jgi:hypothetical protein
MSPRLSVLDCISTPTGTSSDGAVGVNLSLRKLMVDLSLSCDILRDIYPVRTSILFACQQMAFHPNLQQLHP